MLRKFETVRFSRIDIGMFFLFLNIRKSVDIDLTTLFWKCPFTYHIREVLSGNWDTLVTLAIPENVNSLESVRGVLKKLNKAGINSRLVEVTSSGVSNSFDYYSSCSGCWEIPWDLERLLLSKIYCERLAEVFPRVDHGRVYTDIDIDEIDIRILDMFWRGCNTVSEIRSRLGIGRQKVVNRIKRLRESEMISTIWEVHNIGLVENAYITTKDNDAGMAIAAWIQRLPRAIVSFDERVCLSLVVSLPTGGIHGVANALRVIPREVSINQLGMITKGRWGFPSYEWDTETLSWSFPRDRVNRWLESLDGNI